MSNLETLLTELTSQNVSPQQTISKINGSLPNDAAHRDLILAGALSNGSDPLHVLCGNQGTSIPQNTIIILYILIARLTLFLPSGNQNQGNVVPPPPWEAIELWSRNFDSVAARHAPKEVTALSRLILRFAQRTANSKNAIAPLFDILSRFASSIDILTTVHVHFLLACASTKSYTAALPLLDSPITGVGPSSDGLSHRAYPSTDLTYQDVLNYHFTAGHILAALERWSEAEEYLEAVVLHPGAAVSAVQLEALKRLRLVQLIGRGEAPPLPKQVHPTLLRMFRSSPYHAFLSNYPSNRTLLQALADGTQHFGDSESKVWQSERNSKDIFNSDRNYGLVLEALKQAPKWQLKRLTNTYVTLGVDEIGKLVGLTDEDEVLRLVVGMIESKLINATISYDSSGKCAVRFDDDEVNVSKAQIDALLRSAQQEAELLQLLDEETNSSKDYLSKAVKARSTEGDVGGMGAPLFGGPGGMIEEELWNNEEMMNVY